MKRKAVLFLALLMLALSGCAKWKGADEPAPLQTEVWEEPYLGEDADAPEAAFSLSLIICCSVTSIATTMPSHSGL